MVDGWGVYGLKGSDELSRLFSFRIVDSKSDVARYSFMPYKPSWHIHWDGGP